MKVFISWSGDNSKKHAESLRDWLPSVLQFVQPYFTPSDIGKGNRWNNDIALELENSEFGILWGVKNRDRHLFRNYVFNIIR